MSKKNLNDQSMNKKEKDADGLYVVENEDEIEKELEAANNLKKMEMNVRYIYTESSKYLLFKQLKNLKNEVERKKREMVQNKLVQIETEKKKMASRLE